MRRAPGPLRRLLPALLSLGAASTPALSDGVLCLERAYLSRCDTPGFARRVTIADSVAYVADWTGGFSTIDVSDPSAPALLATYDVSSVFEVEVVEMVAYAACASDGLHILDVSDPADPKLIGVFDTEREVRSVVVQDGVAFIADDEDGWKAVDISDPTAPMLLGGHSYPTKDLDVEGSFAYGVDGSRMRVFDVSSPGAPVLLATYDPWSMANTVEVAGAQAFLCGYNGVTAVDVSDPAAPATLGEYVALERAKSIAVIGPLVYIADSDAASGVQAVDFTDVAKPARVMRYGTDGIASGVTVVGDIAYIADGEAGLRVLRVDAVRTEPWIGGCDTGLTVGMLVDGNTLYLRSTHGIEAFDTASQGAPKLLGSWQSDYELTSISVHAGRAYLARGTYGFAIVDVADPRNMVLLGEFDGGPGVTSDVVAGGSVAFVANRTFQGDLDVMNVSDPSSPVLLGRCRVPGTANALAIAGAFLFVAAGEDGGLQIVDVSDPTAPFVAAGVDTPGGAVDVGAFGNTVLLADGAEGLVVIDAGDPVHPEMRFTIDQSTFEIASPGPSVLVASSYDLKLIDLVGDSPREVFSFDSGYRLGMPALAGDVACIVGTDGLQDLALLDISDCPPCPADFNGDSGVDSRDMIDFLNTWVAERTQDCSSGDCEADLDENGSVDSRDFVAFLNAWAAGC